MTAILLVPHNRAYPRMLAVLTGSGSCAAASAASRGATTTVVGVVRMDTAAPVVDRHLRVDATADRSWRMAADVLTGCGGPQMAHRLADHHPGALVTATCRGSECWMRLGQDEKTLLRAYTQRLASDEVDLWRDQWWPMWASALHGWLVAGLPVAALAQSSANLLRPPEGSGTLAQAHTPLLRAGGAPRR